MRPCRRRSLRGPWQLAGLGRWRDDADSEVPSPEEEGVPAAGAGGALEPGLIW